jgi:hypothetical protein
VKKPRIQDRRAVLLYTAYNGALFVWFAATRTPSWLWGVLAFNLVMNIVMVLNTEITEKKR